MGLVYYKSSSWIFFFLLLWLVFKMYKIIMYDEDKLAVIFILFHIVGLRPSELVLALFFRRPWMGGSVAAKDEEKRF